MMKLLTAVTSALVFLAPLQVQAQTNPLMDFQGTWRGVGESRTDINSPFSSAFCNITIEWIGNGIEIDGTCTSEGRGTFAGGGAIRGDGTTLTGAFMNPYMIEVNYGLIEWRGNSIHSETTINVDDIILEFRVDIDRPVIEGTNYVLYMRTNMSVNDGPWTEAGNMRLVAE